MLKGSEKQEMKILSRGKEELPANLCWLICSWLTKHVEIPKIIDIMKYFESHKKCVKMVDDDYKITIRKADVDVVKVDALAH